MKTFRSLLIFALTFVGSLASAQTPTGQPCHNNKKDPEFGLYCPTINATFVGPKNSSQTITTTVISGVVTPITGTLTFAPGPGVMPVIDDYDENGNPICYAYDASGNVTGTITCATVPSYDITQWDITIGAVHFIHDPLNPSRTNSSCGIGYSNSFKTDAGNTVYYVCGNNSDAASTGVVVLVIPRLRQSSRGRPGDGGGWKRIVLRYGPVQRIYHSQRLYCGRFGSSGQAQRKEVKRRVSARAHLKSSKSSRRARFRKPNRL